MKVWYTWAELGLARLPLEAGGWLLWTLGTLGLEAVCTALQSRHGARGGDHLGVNTVEADNGCSFATPVSAPELAHLFLHLRHLPGVWKLESCVRRLEGVMASEGVAQSPWREIRFVPHAQPSSFPSP